MLEKKAWNTLPGMLACICNPRADGMETGRSLHLPNQEARLICWVLKNKEILPGKIKAENIWEKA